MIDLWLSLYDAPTGVHAQTLMKDLGITYRYAVPQSIADGWQFFNCKNLPTDLPSYIRVMPETIDYITRVGHGLSVDEANQLNSDLEQERLNEN